MGDQNAKISGQGSAATGGTFDDQNEMEFIEMLKSEVFPKLPDNNVVALVEELREAHGIYSASDLSYVKWKDLTLKSIRGAQLSRFQEYVEKVQGQQNPQQPQPLGEKQQETPRVVRMIKVNEGGKASLDLKNPNMKIRAGGNNGGNDVAMIEGNVDLKMVDGLMEIVADGGKKIDDQSKTLFIAVLKSSVLQTLPQNKVVALVEELEESYGIYSPADLSEVNLEKLKLTSIKGVQLEKFVKYAQSFKVQKNPPTSSPPPAGMYN